jgi:hypothetical protein
VGPPNSAGGSDRGTGRSLEVLDVRKKKVNMFRGPAHPGAWLDVNLRDHDKARSLAHVSRTYCTTSL